MPSECYKCHGHATHLMSVQCLSDAPSVCLLFIVELMPLNLLSEHILKSSRLHDSFSANRSGKGEMLLLCEFTKEGII